MAIFPVSDDDLSRIREYAKAEPLFDFAGIKVFANPIVPMGEMWAVSNNKIYRWPKIEEVL